MVGVGEMSMIIDVCEVIITDEGCATLDSRAQPEILIGGEGKIFTKIMKFSKMVNYASENWACTIGTGSHELKNVTSLLDSLVARNKYSVVSAQTWSRVHCVMCSRAHRYRICEFAKQEVDLLREILLNSLLVEKTGQVCLITTCSRGNQCHFTFMVEEAWPTIFY